MVRILLIVLSIVCLSLTDSQEIARDDACDLSSDGETAVLPTTITYAFAYSARTISPKIIYKEDGDFKTDANMFDDGVRPELAEVYSSLGLADVIAIQLRPSGHEFALVDFVISCEKNVSHDVISAAMTNVAKNTDYIDEHSLVVYEKVIYCLRQEFKTKVGTFTWPVTPEGSTVNTKESCSHESVNGAEYKLAVRKCFSASTGAQWDSFQCTDCGGASASYLLQQLFQSLPNGDSAEDLMRQVANITTMTNSVRVGGLEAAVDIIEYILAQTQVSTLTYEVVNDLVRVVHNIQQISAKIVTDAQLTYFTSSRLLNALYAVLQSMEINPLGKYESVQDSIGVFVAELGDSLQADTWYQFGVQESSLNDDIWTVRDVFVKPNEATPHPVGDAMIYVKNLQENGNHRIVFIIHRDDVLFRSASDQLRLSSTNADYLREINTRIITSFVFGNTTSEPKISAYFKPIKTENRTLNEECKSWDWPVGKHAQGLWTNKGCTTATEKEHFLCTCKTYSSFAVAVDVHPVPIAVPPEYVISRIGCGLALLFLLITVLIFVSLKDLRGSKPHQMLTHLFLALAVWHLSFLIGINLTSSRGVCLVFGFIMHYGILVASCWMIVGAIDIYIVFVKARALPVKRFVLKCSILSWGLPMLIVSLVAAVDLDLYREEDKHCFLVKTPAFALIISLVVPILATMISISIVYYMACTMKVRKLDGKMEDEGDPVFRKRQQARVLVIASSVIVTLGLITIIFGLFAIYNATIATEVIFLLLCILEGLSIFQICCVWPTEVRHLWLKKLGVLKQNPTKQGVFRPYWSLSKWTSKSVLPEAAPQFFLDDSVNGNGIVTPQNIVLETFPMSENNTLRESTA